MTPSIIAFVDILIANNALAIAEHLATDAHYAKLSSTARWEIRDRNEAYLKLKRVRHDLGNLMDWAVDIEAMIDDLQAKVSAKPVPFDFVTQGPQALAAIHTELEKLNVTGNTLLKAEALGQMFMQGLTGIQNSNKIVMTKDAVLKRASVLGDGTGGINS